MAEPNLNVEFSAVTDLKGKFARLAKLLGLADADHARGKCEHLWMACTTRGEVDLPRWLVEQHLGERGPEALVLAELARWAAGRGDSDTRRMRISGARKHCTWMVSKTEQSSKGGKLRASTASRVGGKFARNPTSPNQPSDPDPDPIPEDQISPSRAIPPTTAPELGPPVARVPDPIVPAVSPPPAHREDIARTPSLDDLWSELEVERRRVLKASYRPLVAHDPGRADLAEALATATRSGKRDQLVGQVRHAIAVAGAEAEVDRDRRQWFTGAIFQPRNFRRLAVADLASARRPKETRRNGQPDHSNAPTPSELRDLTSGRRAPDPKLSIGDRAELIALADRLASNPSEAAAEELSRGLVPRHLETAKLVRMFGDGDQRVPPVRAPSTDEPDDDQQPKPKAAT